MKKTVALLIAMLLALMMLAPALAETADADPDSQTVEAAEEEAGEAAAEASPEPSPIIKKLLEQKWYVWALLVAMVIAAGALFIGARDVKWNSQQLAMGSMCIAISFVLNCIQLVRMPQGGLITPASMLPVVLFMMAYGPLAGFLVGATFGILMLIADPFVIHPIQLLVDYPLAYGAMALCCLARPLPVRNQWKLPIAVLLAGFGRYIFAVLSGAIFFAEYAGEQNAWIYSLVYNLSYLGPDTLVCAVVSCIPGMPRLVDMIKGQRH